MPYNVTAGYALPNNETPPGFKTMHINQSGLASVTESANKITGIATTDTTDDAWYEFEAAVGEGQFLRVKSAEKGGKEHSTTINYRFGGLSQDQLDTIEEVASSSNLLVILQMQDDTYWMVNRRGMNATTTSFDSGVSGGGGAVVGDAMVLLGSDYYDIQEVTVATDLAAITNV